MRGSQKLELLQRIASSITGRYDWDDIYRYLVHYGIRTTDMQNYNSQLEYVKVHLADAPANVLVDIAEDLELELPAARRESLVPPKNWPDDNKFRLFISHLSKDKRHATRLRDCLVPHHINAFVAHQDIQPTLEWQREIERALNVMDAFLCIHTTGFAGSVWTQQEIGFAIARGIKIVSLKFDEDPTGFIARQQALPRMGRTAEEIAKELSALFVADPLTKERFASVTRSKKQTIDNEIPF